MREYKTSVEEYATKNPAQRIARLKWWFLVLVIVGLLALIFVFVFEVPDQLQKAEKPQAGLVQTNPYYSFASFTQTQGQSPNDLKPYIMIGIFAMLAVVLISSLAVQLLAKDPERVKAAGDIVKTCIGFFIGVATSYVGK